MADSNGGCRGSRRRAFAGGNGQEVAPVCLRARRSGLGGKGDSIAYFGGGKPCVEVKSRVCEGKGLVLGRWKSG